MCTKSFFWNVRGLNEPDKHKYFAQWRIYNKPYFGAILESHIKKPMFSTILSKVCPRWNFVSNHQYDPDGRIVFIWRSPVTIKVLHQSRQSLTTEVTIPNARRMIVTSIYASNLAAERDDLWTELIGIQQLFSLHLEPWLVAGDFNQITTPSEHSSPTVQAISSDMIKFRDTILHLDLFDLRYHGVFNTWSNKQPTSPIAKKT